jgi:formylglycine-generating enzyme required for sulfatase activity
MQMMRPHRRIYLDEFWIYRLPVTYGQFREYCRHNKKAEMPRNNLLLGVHEELEMDDSFPAVNLNWFAARDYCKWAKVNLPTEAQWEKAARGSNGFLYPWGDEWGWDKANFDNRKSGRKASPCPADRYPEGASPYGAIQMSGNVKEWCEDRFAPYGFDESPLKSVLGMWKFKQTLPDSEAVIKNPVGPAKGGSRVARGSSWANANGHWAGLATYRNADNPMHGHRDIGFRPVSL